MRHIHVYLRKRAARDASRGEVVAQRLAQRQRRLAQLELEIEQTNETHEWEKYKRLQAEYRKLKGTRDAHAHFTNYDQWRAYVAKKWPAAKIHVVKAGDDVVIAASSPGRDNVATFTAKAGSDLGTGTVQDASPPGLSRADRELMDHIIRRTRAGAHQGDMKTAMAYVAKFLGISPDLVRAYFRERGATKDATPKFVEVFTAIQHNDVQRMKTLRRELDPQLAKAKHGSPEYFNLREMVEMLNEVLR